MGGVEVGDEETAGSGGDGFAQAKFGSSMAPTDSFLMLISRILTITNQKICLLGKTEKWAR